MSITHTHPAKPLTIHTLGDKKRDGKKIVSLTAYDYTTAKLLDQTGEVDFLLVGDSLAMTVLGHPNTLCVTVDEMLHHVRAVVRGTKRALVVGDMPFMSYTVDCATAIKNAGRFIQEGQCQAVKLEGASPLVLETVSHLSGIGIPVMGHLGLTPQSVNTLGGFKVQGKTLAQAKQIIQEAKALEAAGAFALILEMVPAELARLITQTLSIPTIGIGAGHWCDGQILVIDDLLGRYPDLSPRFVRQYMDSAALIQMAVSHYAQDVGTEAFPNHEQEAYHLNPSIAQKLSAQCAPYGNKKRPKSVSIEPPEEDFGYFRSDDFRASLKTNRSTLVDPGTYQVPHIKRVI